MISLRAWNLAGWWLAMGAIGIVLTPVTTLAQSVIFGFAFVAIQAGTMWSSVRSREPEGRTEVVGSGRRSIGLRDVVAVEASLLVAFALGRALALLVGL